VMGKKKKSKGGGEEHQYKFTAGIFNFSNSLRKEVAFWY